MIDFHTILKFDSKKKKITIREMFFLYYILMGLASLVIFSYVSLFLYKNFYQTITQSGELIVLRTEVASEDISMLKFDNIVSSLSQKEVKHEIKHTLNF